MCMRSLILFVVALLPCCCQALGSDEPVLLRLAWKPGDTFAYKLDMRVDASAEGETANFRVEADVRLYVKDARRRSDSDGATVDAKQDDAQPGQSFAITGRLIDVELTHGDVHFMLEASGRKIEVTISKNTVGALLDGAPASTEMLDQLRRDLKPLQELLRARVRLVMTEAGQVLEVAGLENMDVAMQKELAMGFIEGMLLPDKPMRIGDQFTERKPLQSLLPSQPGQGADPLAGRTVEIVRTLKSIRAENGNNTAELSAPLKTKLNDVPLDEDGTQGSVELDLLCTTLVDVARGTILKEQVTGTVLLRPKTHEGQPDLITIKANATMALVGWSDTADLASRSPKE